MFEQMITQIENTQKVAQELFTALCHSKVVPVFDIDGVALDATHRQKCFSQEDVDSGRCRADQIGQLDLAAYRANTTEEQVSQDKNLPLMQVMEYLNRAGMPYHVATARVVADCEHSSKLFRDRGIDPVTLICRGGNGDRRKDHVLKVNGLAGLFTPTELSQMVLIDDCLKNCEAVTQIGMRALHVPFEGH